MGREKNWILQTGGHITETYIPDEGDNWTYLASPETMVSKGDRIYLWWNIDERLFGWGEVSETPAVVVEEINPGTEDVRKRNRQLTTVRRSHGFRPAIMKPMMLADSRLRKFAPDTRDDLFALELSTVRANYLNDYIRERNLEAPSGSATIRWLAEDTSPQFIVRTLLTFGGETADGRLVQAVNLPWFEIIKIIQRDPDEVYRIDWRAWEEIIAGAYELDGANVVLTPRSNDKGRDVIATYPQGSIRIFDQVKRYALTNIVEASEVRELLGTLLVQQNVSKGIISTTSTFAPGVADEFKDLMPYRLELRPRNILLPWLEGFVS